jgi:hypothetical protein
MIFYRSAMRACLLVLPFLLPIAMRAQTNCDEGAGPLSTAQPKGMTVQEVIDKFAAREAVFKEARNQYNYTQDISVQELDGSTVTGEYRLVQDVLYDDKGNRIENVKFAPQPSLRQIGLTREDFEDFRNKLPFVLTTEDIPKYNLLYVGAQRVDELDTYVFDLAPKTIEKGQRYFQGRAWVDARDLQVVKTCGKAVPETRADGSNKKKKNVDENLNPKFVTYREQIDGEYWFPTYTMADDILHFRTNDVHIREVIKYTNYKRFGSKVRIIYKGEAKDDSAPTSGTANTKKP